MYKSLWDVVHLFFYFYGDVLMNAQAQTNQNYFDSVLYARCFINEVKIISPKRGDKYCAVNASIVSKDGEDKTV